MSDTPPEPTIEARRGPALSLVWAVPLGAVLVAAFVAWSSWADRGPLISIDFEDAGGITPGETELRFRNVAIGKVESLAFTPDLDRVRISVRIDEDVAPFIDAGAQFWVVRPRISTSEITGLETVLSGNYIEGFWDEDPGGLVTQFTGLQEAPLLTTTQDGLRIELRSSFDAGFVENTPILFKGVEVGRLGNARVSVNGEWVFAQAIIFEPHDQLINTATRFWDTSGFTFTLGPQGADVDFESISSLLSGGVTFDTLVSGGEPIGEGAVFTVYPDESAARNSVFEGADRATVTVSAIFPENISGLSPEADVEWRGVRIGRVANVTGIVDEERFGDSRVRLLATLELRPSRIGLSGSAGPEDALQFLAARIEEGLRARLVSASLLTGGLKVQFVSIEDAEPVEFDVDAQPFPLFPTVESDISDVQATAEGVFERINALPIEDLLDSAIAFLDGATQLVTDGDLSESPAELLGLLQDARGLVGSEEIQALPAEIGSMVEDIASASADLRALMQTFTEADAATRVLAAVDRAGDAAAAAETTLAEMPALVERLSALAEKAEALPLESLLEETEAVMASARAILDQDATRAIPAELSAAIGRVDAILASVESEATVARLSAALAAAETAAGEVSGAVEGVPELVEELRAVAARAEALPLEDLVTEVSGVAEAASALLTSEDTQALPGSLRAALADLETLLADLQEAGAAQRLAEALTAARDAAQDVARATENVPAIVARIDAIAARVETIPLDRIGEDLSGALAALDQVLSDAAEEELPAALSGALSEVEAAVSELRAGGTVENVNATLASAREAADGIAATVTELRSGGLVDNANATLTSLRSAAEQLPALASRVSRTLGQTERTLLAYDDRSDTNAELLQALRDIREAARAIEALAREIERRPNSIIFGR